MAVVLLAGCGDGDPDSAGDGDSDPCVGASCGALRVTVAVDSPLPAELSCGANINSLEAFLLYDNDNCPLSVAAAGVTGSCADVLADRNVQVTLFYRVAGPTALAEQVRLLELPSTSASTVSLSFAGISVDTPYDSDNDGTHNLAEWCAGTL